MESLEKRRENHLVDGSLKIGDYITQTCAVEVKRGIVGEEHDLDSGARSRDVVSVRRVPKQRERRVMSSRRSGREMHVHSDTFLYFLIHFSDSSFKERPIEYIEAVAMLFCITDRLCRNGPVILRP
ncbi:hypothetical protein EVAR_100301_1 [Eumeta japonica]|uniref:Uncharacterized protein n=1 Tax=Eumeta variegata TaxID=151549 RepID=A0A4C1ZUG8_EUMVA|nr:hypothetical protein EVAR_100301_1 [Eumeta japonica]